MAKIRTLYRVKRDTITNKLQLHRYDVIEDTDIFHLLPRKTFARAIVVDKSLLGKLYFESSEDALRDMTEKVQGLLDKNNGKSSSLKDDLDQLQRIYARKK